ncbi:5339_t:CDS:1, partial [Funneliformis caledonium]
MYSFMDPDIWNKAPDNTNVAESCRANSNRDGKSLFLQSAIL